MFSIERNKGLYLELCLLLDYIEDYDDLEWLGYLRHEWESKGVLTAVDLQNVVGLIDDYLPPEIECTNKGCFLVNNNVEAYTPIENLVGEDPLLSQEIINI